MGWNIQKNSTKFGMILNNIAGSVKVDFKTNKLFYITKQI